MGREDLHKNMEDTFSDKEIFQAGDLSAYDCALFIKYIMLLLHICCCRWKISILFLVVVGLQ